MNKKEALVSIILVNYNGIEHLQKCLPTLARQIYKNVEVVLVDNASVDGSVDWVKRTYPKIKIIINKKNLGFAEANNVGYKYTRGDYILLLNNDTKATPNFIVESLKLFETDDKIGCVQSKIVFMDDPKYLDCVGAYLTLTGFLYYNGLFQRDSLKFNKVVEIHTAKGACMMIKREVVEKVKVMGEMFDNRYFAYFEESDLCHRIWLAGYKIVFAPQSLIYHKLGATSSKIAREFLEYHSYKNRINSYSKNFGTALLLTVFPLHLVFCQILALVYLFKGNFGLVLAIEKAFYWNLVNLPGTLERRRIVQHRVRKVKDIEFIPKVTKFVGPGYYFSLLKGLNVPKTIYNRL